MLFFDKMFSFINETYVLLAVSAGLNVFYLRWDSFGNGLNSLITVVILGIVIGFPIFIKYFYSSKRAMDRIWH
jgi:uncharacterized membrane-anchored protein